MLDTPVKCHHLFEEGPTCSRCGVPLNDDDNWQNEIATGDRRLSELDPREQQTMMARIHREVHAHCVLLWTGRRLPMDLAHEWACPDPLELNGWHNTCPEQT